MQLLFDFLPVIAFFVAYQLTNDIFLATGVIIVATVVQVAIYWFRKHRINPMHLASAGFVLVFGGLTLLVRDPVFIMWKVTIVNWLFATAFLASQLPWFGGRPLVQRLMEAAGGAVRLTTVEWRRLNVAWAGFFVISGIANLVAFQTLSEAAWVKFKFYGLLGLTLAFVVAQGFWISARAHSDEMTAN